ncbi:hypothetical protein GCM10011507_31160 [Edaphobacter acidisoli]|uniref:Fibronectin type-III domain-containing protein n=1 Tax=Edaphobacter acidisoli TaxID=2040573 RepID=A0A916W8X6_9BACT|nr:fibronectin type III domain-containing protein [Edaphobacter acidisoli]GGA77685.1 hypothetical protein GCM10011507_31160 [Edaphobacter acidisoli]
MRTLEHARDLALHSGKQVILDGGLYRLTAPLVLTPADDGLSLTAAPGAHPVISGGVRVTHWTLVDKARNLWQAPAPAGLTNTRQLYVDGVRAHRDRGPLPVALTMTATGYQASSDQLSHWRNPTDIELVYTGGNSVWNVRSMGLGSWTQPRCPIASIAGDAITVAEPCWTNSTQRVMLPSGARTANLVGPKSVGKQPSYIENAFELLGTPGEFYFDRAAHTIYYTPRPGENLNTADVEAPVLEKLIDVQSTASQPVSNLKFEGLTFSYATWLFPSTNEGFSEIQANYMVTGPHGYDRQGLCKLVPDGECPFGKWTPEPGNVAVSTGRNITFLRDTFTHLGAAGLAMGDGTQNSLVEGCIFTDISGNGLELGNVDQPLAPISDFTSGNRIENNLFRNVGAEYRGGIGIVIGYARSTLVAHNQLDHLPYAAISIGWGGWPDKIKLPGQANNSGHNVLSDNRISDFMLVLSDGGGIYTQGRTGKDLSDGERVTGNVITSQFSSGHGIYTDNGSAMITIDHNVVFHANHDDINSKHHDYYDGQNGDQFDPLAILNNYYQQGDPDADQKQVRYAGNRLIAQLNEAPSTLLTNAGIQPAFRAIATQPLTRPTAPEPPSRVSSFAKDSSAYISWNPPVFDGGSPITSYTVKANDGTTLHVPAAEFSNKAYVEFKGLHNGQRYTFTVTASNANGASSASLPSPEITVQPLAIAPPAAPASAAAFRDGNVVSIHFSSPQPTEPRSEESPIVAYVVTVLSSGRKVVFTGRNVIALQDGKHVTFNTLTLKAGEKPHFTVAAMNAAGEGKPLTIDAINVRR